MPIVCRKIKKQQQKLWNIKGTVIPIVVGALGKIPKGLVKELEDLEISGQVETIHTTALLNRLKCCEEAWGHEEACCHKNSSEKTSANAGIKICNNK